MLESLATNNESEIVKALRAELLSQQNTFQSEKIKFLEQLKEKDSQLELLSNQIILLKRFKYGRSSEQVFSGQLGFFNEAEALLAESVTGGDDASTGKAKKRGKPKRRPIPENLPRREVIVDLSPEDKQCPQDGTPLKEMGREVSEKLNIIPATVEVVRTIRITYACSRCESFVATAPVPAHILPKSLADVGLLSLILVSKFVDAMSLYRVEKILERIGVEIPRCTMASWVVELGSKFMILSNLLREHLLESDYLRADETHVLVLDNKHGPPKKGEEQKTGPKRGQMWVYTSAGPDPIVIFDYQPGRTKASAGQMLEGYKGYLQVDGYAGYDSFCGEGKATRLGCWAHVRRKFHDAWLVLKKPRTGLAFEALALIAKVYEVEGRAKGKSTDARYAIRQEFTKPLLDEIRTWLENAVNKCLPKSETGEALAYMLGEWSTLTVFLQDGRLEPDNNFTENKIRPFALGRKNWLFSATTEGAESSGVIYSLIETAKANGLDAYDYIHWLLVNFPKAKTVEDFENLLPHNAKKIMRPSDSLQPVLG